MSVFKKGDLAIYVRPGSPHYGKEVEVLSGLKEYCAERIYSGRIGNVYGYEITNLFPDKGDGLIAHHKDLKPKKRQNPDVVETQQSKSWESLKQQWNKVEA